MPYPSTIRKLVYPKTNLTFMDSQELAQYIEATDGISKPWLLIQLRLKKLEESKASLSPQEYVQKLSDIYQDLMHLGEWWRGIENEVF